MQQQMAVEIEPQSAPIRFTRRVPIATPFDLPETAECNLEPPSMRSKSRPHLGNAGLGLDHMPAGDKLALAMIPEIDIWRAASLMLKRYGEKRSRKALRAPMSFSLSRITTAPPCGAGSSTQSASSPR